MKRHPIYQNYFITKDGKVFSEKRNRWLNPWIHRRETGYQIVKINGQRQFIHRLVLETFVGPCPKGMMCRHLDGNPTNNNLNNLVWGTPSENQKDAVRQGTHFQVDNSGEKHGNCKFLDQEIMEMIDLRKHGFKYKEISDLYDINKNYLESICNGRRRA
jgi:hypothetical protein